MGWNLGVWLDRFDGGGMGKEGAGFLSRQKLDTLASLFSLGGFATHERNETRVGSDKLYVTVVAR